LMKKFPSECVIQDDQHNLSAQIPADSKKSEMGKKLTVGRFDKFLHV
jgi:hypothetical protein